MSQDTNTAPQRRSPVWMRVLLGVSLALNLAVVGIVAGVALRFGGDDRPGHPPRMGSATIRALPAEDRRAILNRARAEVKTTRRPRSDVAEMAALLRAAPYDHGALEALVAERRAQRQGWITAMQGAWLEHVATMTEAERMDYAQALEEAGKDRRRPPHPKHHGPKHGGPKHDGLPKH